MGERVVRNDEVRGSIPLGSTSAVKNLGFPQNRRKPRFFNPLATQWCYTWGMKEVGKPSGLVKRQGSAVWYFRQRCPLRLRAPGVPEQIWISLETASYQNALTRLEDARQEALRRFAVPQPRAAIYSRSLLPTWLADESLPLLTNELAAPLARAFLIDVVRELDSEPLTRAGFDDADKQTWRIELENTLARVTGPEPDDGVDDVAGAKFAVLRKARLRTDPGSDPCNLLHNYLRRAMAQSCQIRLARLEGDYADRITDRLFANCLSDGIVGQRDPPPGEAVMAAPSGVKEQSLANATERYLGELLAKSTTAKTKDRYRSELKHLVAFFGQDTPVWKIDGDECDRFRDTFALLPPNFEDKIRNGKGISTIAAGHTEGDQVLAYATLDKYLSQLSRFLKWADKKDYVAKNYAEGLKPLASKPDGSMAKLPFEPEELRRIFHRPIYTGCRDDGRNFSRVGPNIIRRARYWAPLIGLFGGLRCGEILQLTTAHFRVSPDGHDFIVLTPDMKLKTDNAIREIPVHPVLKAIGLVEWVGRRRDRGELALFPEVPAHSAYEDQSSRFSKWYESDLRHFDLGERRAKLTFHSFRHTFKQGLNRADVPEEKKDDLCGWSRSKNTGRRYGLGLEADVLKTCVDAVDYRLNFSHLYAHAGMAD
jgi:integrase